MWMVQVWVPTSVPLAFIATTRMRRSAGGRLVTTMLGRGRTATVRPFRSQRKVTGPWTLRGGATRNASVVPSWSCKSAAAGTTLRVGLASVVEEEEEGVDVDDAEEEDVDSTVVVDVEM